MEEKKENEEVKAEKNNSKGQKEEPKNNVENKTTTEATKKDENQKKVETKKEEKNSNKEVVDNKKEEKKAKPESKDSKNNGLWVLAVVLIVVLVVIIAILALRQKSAKETVEAMLNCLKTGDFNSISNYTDYNDLIKTADIENEDQTMTEEAQRLLFNKLSWKIGDVKEEQDNATVDVEVTNKNFETILNNYMQKVVKIALSGTEPTEEEYNNYLLEELKKEDIPTTTVTKTIELTKVDGKWRVTANSELVSLLLPGLESVINTNIDA